MTGFTLGGATGATLGEATGGTLGNDPTPNENYLLDGLELPAYTSEIATYQSLILGFRVQTQTLLDVLRTAKVDENKIDVIDTDPGGFRAVDRSGGSNTYRVTPPDARQPLREAGTYHVARYEETLVSRTVDEWHVEIEFIRSAPRTDRTTATDAVTAEAFPLTFDVTFTQDEWGIETEYGSFATDRVDADVLGTGRQGVPQFELTFRLTFDEAYAFETAVSNLGDGRIRMLPDATNQPVDESTSNDATITINSPTPTVVPDGDYLVLGWESERLNDAAQTVRVTVAKA